MAVPTPTQYTTLLALSFMSLILILSSMAYRIMGAAGTSTLYRTQHPILKAAAHTVETTGFLEIPDSMRIGSLISGVIKEMHVEENTFVKKGDLLAIIDDGYDGNLLNEAAAVLQRTQAALEYLTSFHRRQEYLFQHGHISLDTFEQATRELKVAQANVAQAHAKHDQEKLTIQNKRIIAPADGLVIEKVARTGEAVTLTSPAPLIYIIVKDISKMQAKIKVPEEHIALINKGMKTSITLKAFPTVPIKGIISSIGSAPSSHENTVSYTVTAPITHCPLHLRPGMSFTARIETQRATVTIPITALSLDTQKINHIAHNLGYRVQALPPDQQAQIEQDPTLDAVWIEQNDTLIETLVTIGSSDDENVEIIDGIDQSALVITELSPEAAPTPAINTHVSMLWQQLPGKSSKLRTL